jgi:hypothetical protein
MLLARSRLRVDLEQLRAPVAAETSGDAADLPTPSTPGTTASQMLPGEPDAAPGPSTSANSARPKSSSPGPAQDAGADAGVADPLAASSGDGERATRSATEDRRLPEPMEEEEEEEECPAVVPDIIDLTLSPSTFDWVALPDVLAAGVFPKLEPKEEEEDLLHALVGRSMPAPQPERAVDDDVSLERPRKRMRSSSVDEAGREPSRRSASIIAREREQASTLPTPPPTEYDVERQQRAAMMPPSSSLEEGQLRESWAQYSLEDGEVVETGIIRPLAQDVPMDDVEADDDLEIDELSDEMEDGELAIGPRSSAAEGQQTAADPLSPEEGKLEEPTSDPERAHLAPSHSPTAKAEEPEPVVFPRGVKLSIAHLPILYHTQGKTMICRMCTNLREHAPEVRVARFDVSASWQTLMDHCEHEHWDVCVRLSEVPKRELTKMCLDLNGGAGHS